jgi:hypothetical protein
MSDLMPRPVETAISLYRGRKQWDREDENKESENGVQVPIRGAWRAGHIACISVVRPPIHAHAYGRDKPADSKSTGFRSLILAFSDG